MGHDLALHAPHGGADFLGLRHRRGATEIVYDDGDRLREIWQVRGETPGQRLDNGRIEEALRIALGSLRVLPTLHAELKKRAMGIDRVAG